MWSSFVSPAFGYAAPVDPFGRAGPAVTLMSAQKSPRTGRGRMGCRDGSPYWSMRRSPTTTTINFISRGSSLSDRRLGAALDFVNSRQLEPPQRTSWVIFPHLAIDFTTAGLPLYGA